LRFLAAALGSDFGYWLTAIPSGREHPLASGAWLGGVVAALIGMSDF